MTTETSLSERIAYVGINPGGKFARSAQRGFEEVGVRPKYLIRVSPVARLKREFRRYRLGVFRRFLFAKIQQHAGNTQSFSNKTVDIPIPCRRSVSRLNSQETVEILRSWNIKYLVNCGAGIFRPILTTLPGLYIINAHAGRLPGYRNMNVVEWALYNREPVFGTVHLIDAGIDTGPVLHEEELNLTGCGDIQSCRDAAFDQVIRLVGKVVVGLERGSIAPVSQPNDGRLWYTMHPLLQRRLNERMAAAR